MASWRIGYMVIPESLWDAINKIQDTLLICAPVVSQRAAVAALGVGRAYAASKLGPLAEMRQTDRRARSTIRRCRAPCRSAPGAFYFFVRVFAPLSSPLDLTERLIREHRVAVVPGIAFGGDECSIRVSYGALDPSTRRTKARGGSSADFRSLAAHVKVLTWNVNGIRARQHEVADVHRRPSSRTSSASRRSRRRRTKCRRSWWRPTAIGATGTAPSGYSGVALLIRHSFFTERPAFRHPSFDHEERIVVADLGPLTVASVYVPNGGKDFDAKLRFLEALVAWAAETQASGRALLICGDLNVAREERDVHPKERKPNQIGTRPEETGASGRAARGRTWSMSGGARPGQQRAVHLVGALAEPPATQYRLADRLRAGQPDCSRRPRRDRCRCENSGRAITRPVVTTFA